MGRSSGTAGDGGYDLALKGGISIGPSLQGYKGRGSGIFTRMRRCYLALAANVKANRRLRSRGVGLLQGGAEATQKIPHERRRKRQPREDARRHVGGPGSADAAIVEHVRPVVG